MLEKDRWFLNLIYKLSNTWVGRVRVKPNIPYLTTFSSAQFVLCFFFFLFLTMSHRNLESKHHFTYRAPFETTSPVCLCPWVRYWSRYISRVFLLLTEQTHGGTCGGHVWKSLPSLILVQREPLQPQPHCLSEFIAAICGG